MDSKGFFNRLDQFETLYKKILINKKKHPEDEYKDEVAYDMKNLIKIMIN